MKVALVTTPPAVRSGIGDYTRHLLPYLREHCEVDLYVESDTTWEGEEVRLARDLKPRDYDQILYQLGNEQSHAFMVHMIRAIGGTVMQHDWVLFDMAMATWPGLSRGGAKGHLLALREGGLIQARIYSQNWIHRRRQRKRKRQRPEYCWKTSARAMAASSKCTGQTPIAAGRSPRPTSLWAMPSALL